MKRTSSRTRVLAVGYLLSVGSVLGQGTFQNLDFELANVPDLPLGQYGSLNGTPAADAFPYWTAYYGAIQTTLVTHNGSTLGSANISIIGPNWDNNSGIYIIDGRYSALLQAGSGPSGPHDTASIAQIGTIPPTARSIQVRVNPFGGLIPGVSFSGQNVPMVTLAQNSPSDLLLGGDISAFAGQSGELRLAALNRPGFYFGSFVVDSVVFSASPIPEPSSLVLLLCGGCGLLVSTRRKRAA